jgi:phosphopantothenoylcysteine decarboxylase/phosphopantothenate--cysteine ligase
VTEDNKIKKKDGDLSIPLVRTKDILKALGENKRPGQILCGFSMETENVLENSRKKLESKHCDMICANSLKSAGAGFGTDTKNSEESLELMSKEQVAHKILDKLLAIVQP